MFDVMLQGVLSCLLLYVSWTDLEERIIPNGALAALVGVRLVGLTLCPSGVVSAGCWGVEALAASTVAMVAVLALLLASSALARVLVPGAVIGAGDCKLFGVLALFLDPMGAFVLLALSAGCGVALGGVWAVVLKERCFPFGPAIALGFFLTEVVLLA